MLFCLFIIINTNYGWTLSLIRTFPVEEQPNEESEVFSSPLESPSKFTSYTSEPGDYLQPKHDTERKTDVDSQISMDLKRQDTPLKRREQVTSAPAEFPYIQLTPHANLRTPVQSDSTNRIISSSSNFPSYPAYESSLSTPYLRGGITGSPSSFVFSPPLTRSSVKR